MDYRQTKIGIAFALAVMMFVIPSLADSFEYNASASAVQCVGNFSSSHPCSKAYDNNWSTYAAPNASQNVQIIYNWTLPDFTNYVNLTVKYQTDESTQCYVYALNWTSGSYVKIYDCPTLTLENKTLTLPYEMFKGNKVSINVTFRDGGGANLHDTLYEAKINGTYGMLSSRISPTTAYANDTLLGYCNVTNSIGNVSYSYRWYKNGILNASGTFGGWCYQETANVSTDCGGVSTGSYAFNVSSNNIYINYSKPTTASNTSLWQVKQGYAGAPPPSPKLVNITLPNNCWIQSPLQYKLVSYDDPTNGYSDAYCWNGTSWQNILHVSLLSTGPDPPISGNATLVFDGNWSTGAYFDVNNGSWRQPLYEKGSILWEEAMWWDIKYPSGIEQNVANVSSPLTKYNNWTLSCLASDSTANTSWLNSSVVTILNSPPTFPVLSTPIDNFNTTDRTPFFNWTASTDLDNDTITYDILIDDNSSFSSPIQSNSSLTSNNYTATTLNDGTYYWKVKAITSDANSSYTAYRTFTIDATSPAIIYNPSTTPSGIQSATWTFVNISTIDAHPNSVKLYWNGVPENFQNNQNVSSLCYQEFTNVSTACGGLSIGNYSEYLVSNSSWRDGDWSTYATLGNSTDAGYADMEYTRPPFAVSAVLQVKNDTSSVFNLTVPSRCFNYNSDLLFLAIGYLGFHEIQCYDGSDWNTLWSYSDPNDTYFTLYEEAIWWNMSTDYYWSNKTSLADGNYTFYAWTNDTFGNSNQTSNRTVIVDTINPTISYNPSTTSSGTQSATWIFVNATANDTNLDSVKLYWNGVPENFQTTNGNKYWSNKTGLSSGIYIFSAWANDTVGHTNQTDNRTVKIDLPANITIVSPQQISYSTYNITLNYTVSDDWNNTEMSCDNYIDSVLNETVNVTNGTYYDKLMIFNTTGPHNVSVTCFDGFQNSTSLRIFSINDSPPNVTINSPLNETSYNTSFVILNVSASDDFTANLSCWYFRDSVLSGAFTVLSGTTYQKSMLDHSYGPHEVYVTCSDNYQNTTTPTVYYNTTPPRITSSKFIFKFTGNAKEAYLNLSLLDDDTNIINWQFVSQAQQITFTNTTLYLNLTNVTFPINSLLYIIDSDSNISQAYNFSYSSPYFYQNETGTANVSYQLPTRNVSFTNSNTEKLVNVSWEFTSPPSSTNLTAITGNILNINGTDEAKSVWSGDFITESFSSESQDNSKQTEAGGEVYTKINMFSNETLNVTWNVSLPTLCRLSWTQNVSETIIANNVVNNITTIGCNNTNLITKSNVSISIGYITKDETVYGNDTIFVNNTDSVNYTNVKINGTGMYPTGWSIIGNDSQFTNINANSTSYLNFTVSHTSFVTEKITNSSDCSGMTNLIVTSPYCYSHFTESLSSGYTRHHYVLRFVENVNDDFASSYNILLPFNKLLFPDWSDKSAIIYYYANLTSTNVSLSENSSYIFITVGTNHTASSLHYGENPIEIKYIRDVAPPPPSGGGGGGAYTPIQAVNFTVTPPLWETFVVPGTEVLQQFELYNPGSQETKVTASFEPFGLDQSYVWALIRTDNTVYTTHEFTVPSKSKVQFYIVVRVPSGAELQDYNFVAKFEAGEFKVSVPVKLAVTRQPAVTQILSKTTSDILVFLETRIITFPVSVIGIDGVYVWELVVVLVYAVAVTIIIKRPRLR